MKKYIFTLSAILLVVLLPGCEKEFDGLVDTGESTYKIAGINSFNEVNYGLQDSTVRLWIQLENDNDVSSVSCSLLDPDGEELEGSPVTLVKSEGRYSGGYTFSYSDIIGQYTINYYVTDNASGTKLAASHYFNYDNGQANIAPVLTNLVFKDTVNIGESFTFTIIPTDANGSSDIIAVYFELTRPNGTKVEESPGDTFFAMHDDGNMNYGDATANDGIYSFKNYFLEGSLTGTWKFEFQAIDRRGLTSEKIIHNLVVK
jgi:hypothetical protein